MPFWTWASSASLSLKGAELAGDGHAEGVEHLVGRRGRTGRRRGGGGAWAPAVTASRPIQQPTAARTNSEREEWVFEAMFCLSKPWRVIPWGPRAPVRGIVEESGGRRRRSRPAAGGSMDHNKGPGSREEDGRAEGPPGPFVCWSLTTAARSSRGPHPLPPSRAGGGGGKGENPGMEGAAPPPAPRFVVRDVADPRLAAV